ncbi:Hypothetical_protein [Hexamita inflata]|uniref:Hypothetical_protein n=1 Tax=Hexamita inflata TaxID=28002 RepID=A0AA86Q333_9EUKA|nr:Hypothetical protein HINF_LOCUS4560 [Hexamita inflata]CAI9945560.1 Hypothetical protein HINF_LOCUS33205 [Hexamita inflata]CAI9965077.1 Hypothetical protein HINF_LOCUS52722 [Hexamita inflata]
MTDLQPFLFTSYGCVDTEQIHTQVRFETKSLFNGYTTTMYCSFKMINSQQLPIANFRHDFAQDNIKVVFNNRKLPPLLPTTRVGQFKCLITPQTPNNTLQIFLSDNLIYQEVFDTKPTFEQNPHIKIKQLTCTALAQTLVKIQQVLRSGKGKMVLKFNAPVILGYFVDNQSYMTNVDAGVVEISANGDEITIINQNKKLVGINNRDVQICFRLKAEKTAEIIEM